MASFRMRLDIPMPSEQAIVVLNALIPELKGVGRRTEVSAERMADGLTFQIKASDLIAARAAANSFIRLLDLSISMYGVVGGER